GLLAAGALVAVGALAGALCGALLSVPPADVARLADRGYGLPDRVATALEWGARPHRTAAVGAQVADAVAHAERVGKRPVIARRVPREAKFLPLPVVIGAVLAMAPPVPLPQGSLPSFSVSKEDDEDAPKERAGEMESAERPV